MADLPENDTTEDVVDPDLELEFDDEDELESSTWALRYPPLVSMLAGLLIAILVMPSALNLPQNNPTQTLEFAPVPPEDSDDPPPPDGNFDQLGLGSSESLSGDGALGGDGPGTTTTLPPPVEKGQGGNVSQFRCVEGRQTEDPLAPPCVAFFDGDNFGETYQGVNAEEVNLLVYIDGGVGDTGSSRGREARPTRAFFDLAGADANPEPDEHVYIRVLRGWQEYFNTRYQTYGRFVRFYVYFSPSDGTAESRRADAADVFKRANPFATVVGAEFHGNIDAYTDSMLKRGVLNFGDYLGQDASFYERFPKLLWGFSPSLEIQSQQYSSVLCKKYQPFPVDHSGDYQGEPRKFGLLYTTDSGFKGLQKFKDSVVQRFKACGGVISEEATFPTAGIAVDNRQTPQYALDAMTKFQNAGITTIIWPGGYESKFSKAAAQIGYYPEWILAGDGDLDAEYGNQVNQDQTVWQYAVTTSNQPFVPDDVTRRICFQAYRTVKPDEPRQDVNGYACDFYEGLRQLFIGIQVAGPRLGPTSIDKGFHAIPAIRSQDPQVPACFYLPGDYTCVKDLVLGRWDPAARPGASDPGCWRFAGGTRYLPEDIPGGNATAQMSPGDPCLGYDNGFRLNAAPPDAGVL